MIKVQLEHIPKALRGQLETNSDPYYAPTKKRHSKELIKRNVSQRCNDKLKEDQLESEHIFDEDFSKFQKLMKHMISNGKIKFFESSSTQHHLLKSSSLTKRVRELLKRSMIHKKRNALEMRGKIPDVPEKFQKSCL